MTPPAIAGVDGCPAGWLRISETSGSGALTAHVHATARERLALVERDFGDGYADVRRRFPRSRVADDDILDAFAALWTARRIRAGRAISVPAEPPVDACGLRMEMLA